MKSILDYIHHAISYRYIIYSWFQWEKYTRVWISLAFEEYQFQQLIKNFFEVRLPAIFYNLFVIIKIVELTYGWSSRWPTQWEMDYATAPSESFLQCDRLWRLNLEMCWERLKIHFHKELYSYLTSVMMHDDVNSNFAIRGYIFSFWIILILFEASQINVCNCVMPISIYLFYVSHPSIYWYIYCNIYLGVIVTHCG